MNIPNESLEKNILLHASYKKLPINGTLELLPICNMHCKMCYVWQSKKYVDENGGLLSVDKWIKIAHELQKSGVVFILLSGVEPLLYPGFKKLYVELQKLGMVLTVNTNGTLIDEEWADFFAKHRPRRINITVYGASQETYSTLCGYANGYERTLHGIQLLKDRKLDVKINGSVVRENEHEIFEIYKLGERLDIPVHMDTYMIPKVYNDKKILSQKQESRLEPEDAAFAEYLCMKQEQTIDAFIQYKEKKIQELLENKFYPNGFTCMATNCSFSIDWKGNVRPCVSKAEPSISVLKYGFDHAWKQLRNESKTMMLNEKCQNCDLRPVCKVCVATSLLETKKDDVPEYLCRYAKKMAELLQNEE